MSTHVTIIGNLTRDPEVHDTNPQAPAVTFCVASNRRYTTKGGEQVTESTFLDCVAFRDLGLHIAASLHKGDRVIVQGYMEQSSYEVTDSEGNVQRRSRLRLQVNAIGPDLRFATAEVTKIQRVVDVPSVEVPTAA